MVTSSNYGVDWITGTSKSENVGWKWYEVIRRACDLVLREEGKRYGYSRYGYNGFQVGGMVWAYNEKWGYLVQASGQNAMGLYPSLALPLSRFTRLDLQVTVECDPPEPDYIRHVYLANKDKEMPTFTYYEKLGGDTCYVGSRVSERYGRIYDKGLESGMGQEKGRYIRYEVEVKGEVARKFEETCGLREKMLSGGVESRNTIGSFIHDYFRQRGVEMLYNALPSVPVEVGRRISTAETKLAWINSSVRQSVEFLIDAGWSEQLVKAFGLTEGQAIDLVRALTSHYQMKLPFDDTGG